MPDMTIIGHDHVKSGVGLSGHYGFYGLVRLHHTTTEIVENRPCQLADLRVVVDDEGCSSNHIHAA
jgi:hypothetical protein